MSFDKHELDRMGLALAGESAIRPECDPDGVWRAVQGDLPTREFVQLVDHASECPTCAGWWAMAKTLQDEDPLMAEPVGHVVELSQRRTVRWFAPTALAFAVAAAAVFAVNAPKPTGGQVYRDAQSSAVVLMVADGAALPRDAMRLAWHPIAEDALFSLTVLHPTTFEVLHQAHGLQSETHTVPAHALSDLRSGAQISWWVTAHRSDGAEIRSETRLIEIQ